MVISENELTDTNTLGEKPFFKDDPMTPNEKYFDRVAEIVDEGASHGLYFALVPAWGDLLTAPWGTGPRIFRNDNLPVARAYGKYLSQKLKNKPNIVWLLGGDRPIKLNPAKPNQWPQTQGVKYGFSPNQDWTPIWREIAANKLSAKKIRAWWYDPRTGVGTLIGEFPGGRPMEFRTPPQGPDWVLVLDDVEKNYAPPGLVRLN